jgi:hypothetical protein
MLQFPGPPSRADLDIYQHVAAEMLREHATRHPSDPVCGVVFRFNYPTVELQWRQMDGSETVPGKQYVANACTLKFIGRYLDAARRLREVGINLNQETP